jgi:GNAT superfamily N-acetyltransferase
MARTYPTIAFKDYRIFWVHHATTPEVRERIARFWQDNDAIRDAAEAGRRAEEVGCIVVNAAAEIVAVNTVYPASLVKAGPRYWFYRTFVRPDSRSPGLSSATFRFTVKKLAAAPRDAEAPQGVLVVAENPKLARPGGRRRLERLGLRSRGVGPRGNELWVLDFDAAQPSPDSTV